MKLIQILISTGILCSMVLSVKVKQNTNSLGNILKNSLKNSSEAITHLVKKASDAKYSQFSQFEDDKGWCLNTDDAALIENQCKEWYKDCEQCFDKTYISTCLLACEQTEECNKKKQVCTSSKCLDRTWTCTQCPVGASLVLYKNHTRTCRIDDCPSGTYKPHKDCTACTSCTDPCKTCSQKSDNCTECKPGACYLYSKEDATGTCVDYGAVTKVCPEGQFSTKTEDGDKCTITCGNCTDGYYPDKATGKCEKCCGTCDKCIDTCDNCVFPCKKPKVYHNGRCVDVCPQRTFAVGFRDVSYAYCDPEDDCICSNCHSTCQTCKGHTKKDCITCVAPNILTADGECVAHCPGSHYVDTCSITKEQRCYKCHEDCLSCNGGKANQCTECVTGKSKRGGICLDYQDVQKNIIQPIFGQVSTITYSFQLVSHSQATSCGSGHYFISKSLNQQECETKCKNEDCNAYAFTANIGQCYNCVLYKNCPASELTTTYGEQCGWNLWMKTS